jgi:hypothetical protein
MATRIITQMAKSVCSRDVIRSDIDPPTRCFLVMHHWGLNTSVAFHLEIRRSVVRSTESSASPVEIPFLRLAI